MRAVLIDDSWAFAFAFIGAIGNVATAGALVFLWRQYHLTREEMKSTLRPWIGISDVEIESNAFLTLHVKNYGRTPARIVGLRKVFGKTNISIDQLRSTNAEISGSTLFPDAIIKLSSLLPKNPEFQYVAAMIEYEYANNKHGEYGLIAKRVAESGTVIYEGIFAS